MDRRRRLVDLDRGGARRDQRLELGAQDRDEGLRRRVPVAVDLTRPVGQPAGQRVRPRQGHLQRSRRARRCVPIFGHHTQPVGRGDRFEHLEAVLLVVGAGAQPSVGGQRPDTGHPPVELGGEEAGAPHLAVAHDVDARLLLVAQREVDRIVEHLIEIDRAELAALRGCDARHEPRGPRMRADDARAQDRGHGSPSS